MSDFWACKKCKRRAYLFSWSVVPENGMCHMCAPPTDEQLREWSEFGTSEDDFFRCPWCGGTFDDELHGFDGSQECPFCEKPVYVRIDYTTHVDVRRRT